MIFFPPATQPSIFPGALAAAVQVALRESKVFDVVSDCKDKAAHLTHRAVASREENKFLILSVKAFIPGGTGHFNILQLPLYLSGRSL